MAETRSETQREHCGLHRHKSQPADFTLQLTKAWPVLFVSQGCKTLGFFCSVQCEDRGNNHYWEKTCVCDVTSKGHDTKTLLLLLIIHICASEDFGEDLSSELLGFGFIFGLSFFFLFTAGHLAHKSCLFCRLLSSLRQQVFCQQKWGAGIKFITAAVALLWTWAVRRSGQKSYPVSCVIWSAESYGT